MTLDKAIQVLTVENRYPWNRDNSKLRDAAQLGIEALKRVQTTRRYKDPGYSVLLPGETRD